ncbi:hypothetical protein [Fischerella thermalis]|nr:hypothetical protein [Fischerella thermalis]
MAQEYCSEISLPLLLSGSDRDLNLESTLEELEVIRKENLKSF